MKLNKIIFIIFLLISLSHSEIISRNVTDETIPLQKYVNSRLLYSVYQSSIVEYEFRNSQIEGVKFIDSVLIIDFEDGDFLDFNTKLRVHVQSSPAHHCVDILHFISVLPYITITVRSFDPFRQGPARDA